MLLVSLFACQNKENNKAKTLAQIEKYNYFSNKVYQAMKNYKSDDKLAFETKLAQIMIDSIPDFCPNEKLLTRAEYLLYQGNFYKRIFNTIKEEYIYTNETNWDEIKLLINDSIPVFRGNEDNKRATRLVLDYLNVKHSFIANDSNEIFRRHDTVSSDVEAKLLEGDIAYLRLGNHALNSLYTIAIREAILKLDREAKLSAWIIDLRDCHGGKSGAIALGLAPLYTDSIIGYSLNNKGEYLSERIVNDAYFCGEFKQIEISRKKETIQNKNKPIAVLVSERTASMAECTALSFKFQEGSRIFGQETANYTTLMRIFDVSSNWAFGIPTAFMCDKNKKPLKGAVIPDVACPSEEALDRAIQWIREVS